MQFPTANAYLTQGSSEIQRCSTSLRFLPQRFWQRTHTCCLPSGCLSGFSSGCFPCIPSALTHLSLWTELCRIWIKTKQHLLHFTSPRTVLPCSLPCYIHVFSVHLSCFNFTGFTCFYKEPHLVSPAVAFPISTTGSTQETSTDCGDMTLTLMSWATYSGGSETTSTHITAQIQRGKSVWLQTNLTLNYNIWLWDDF